MIDVSPNATTISHRPAWAEETRIESGGITHSWTSPTVADTIEPRSGEFQPAPVELVQEDLLYTNNQGVVLDPGPHRIFLLDENLDLENARKLATAILECCDRAEGVDR